MNARQRFRQTVETTKGLHGAYQSGLQAMKSSERSRLSVREPRKLLGSVDIDQALQPLYPNASRWDYVIGMEGPVDSSRLIWIEVHPANSKFVTDIIGKREWLFAWLAGDGTPLRESGGAFLDLRWIATGRVAFRRGSRQSRVLAQKGVKFPVEHLMV